MTGDLRINTDQLDEHRCHVAHVGQEIQMARDASVQVGVGDGAFGVLCSPFLVPPLSLVEGQARDALSSASSALDRLCSQLGITVEDFTAHEDELTRSFNNEVSVWGKRGRRG